MISEKISALFKSSGITISNRQLDMFRKLYGLLTEHNSELDLTRLKTVDDIIVKHFIDSVYFLKYTDMTGSLLDIGTGPGFPGVPIKIIKPELKLILAEPRYKRVHFLNMLIEELKLEDVEVYPHLVTDKSFFNVNGVITRALESVDETLTRISHFLPEGGLVYFMKGPESGNDVGRLSPSNSRSFKLEEDIDYTLPGTTYKRRLAVYRCNEQRFRKTYKIMINESEGEGIAVTSQDNKRFKQLKKLLASEGIKKYGKVLVSGKKIVGEIATGSQYEIEEMIIYDGYAEKDEGFEDILKKCSEAGKLLVLKKSLFNQLDLISTAMPLAVIMVPGITEWNYTLEDGCTLLIPFQDPLNVGSVIRTAAGFGINRVVLMREAANPYHPRSIRSSGGYVFKTEMFNGPSINDIGKIADKHGLDIVTLDSRGSDIRAFSFPEKFLLLPGLEGQGLPETLRGKSVSINLEEGVESLNAAVAASIFMYEWAGRK